MKHPKTLAGIAALSLAVSACGGTTAGTTTTTDAPVTTATGDAMVQSQLAAQLATLRTSVSNFVTETTDTPAVHSALQDLNDHLGTLEQQAQSSIETVDASAVADIQGTVADLQETIQADSDRLSAGFRSDWSDFVTSFQSFVTSANS